VTAQYDPPCWRLCVVVSVIALAACHSQRSIAGLWSATVTVGTTRVPFQFEVTGAGGNLQGTFVNGDTRVPSAGVRYDKDTIVFSYPEYGAELDLAVHGSTLKGRYAYAGGFVYDFEAEPFRPAPAPANVPDIAGDWIVQVPRTKGEQAWHLVITQSGAQMSAAILRVDGDSGAVTGAFDGRKFVLGHFSGARPLRLELTPQSDGSLSVERDSYYIYRANRSSDARASGLAEPADPSRYASIKDPSEPFAFSFADLDGHVVANTDPRFVRKVVVVSVGGSWCPNCHDEAPFLAELYRTYRDRGLEVVLISFEEGAQLKTLDRLRAFARRYELTFPVLVGGDTRLVHARLPRLEAIEVFPTTIFIGRDGLVRSIHVGFASEASGSFHVRLKETITALIERLIAEPSSKS
jgi:peroxiredoxin